MKFSFPKIFGETKKPVRDVENNFKHCNFVSQDGNSCHRRAHMGIKILSFGNVFHLTETNPYEEITYCYPHFLEVLRITANDCEQWMTENPKCGFEGCSCRG